MEENSMLYRKIYREVLHWSHEDVRNERVIASFRQGLKQVEYKVLERFETKIFTKDMKAHTFYISLVRTLIGDKLHYVCSEDILSYDKNMGIYDTLDEAKDRIADAIHDVTSRVRGDIQLGFCSNIEEIHALKDLEWELAYDRKGNLMYGKSVIFYGGVSILAFSISRDLNNETKSGNSDMLFLSVNDKVLTFFPSLPDLQQKAYDIVVEKKNLFRSSLGDYSNFTPEEDKDTSEEALLQQEEERKRAFDEETKKLESILNLKKY